MANFTLDSSALGGAQFLPIYAQLETGGEFRAIQYQLVENTISSDLEVHSIGAAINIGGESTSNTAGE